MSQSNSNSDAVAPIGGPNTKTADDIFGELSKDDDLNSLDLNKPIDKKPEDKDEVKEPDDADIDDKDTDDEPEVEIDELDAIEEDLKEIDEEKLELKTPVARREILKKYPKLFEDFPYLETAYYREQQFTEILSTIEDAKIAAESHRVLQAYSEDMVEKGNVSNVLKMIKDANPETYAHVVDNYMGHLEKVDPVAYTHVQSNLVKNLILGMVEEAKSSNDDDLRMAALLLNKYAFGSAKFTPPQKLAKEAKPEDKEKVDSISKREQEFAKKQVDHATGEVNTRVANAIKGAIDNNIDPNGTMTEYVKKNAVRDAVEKINMLIKKDTRFQKIVEKLWDKAAKSNFSKESQDDIRKAHLSKAKSLLAPVIQSARKEALKGMGKRVKDEVVDDSDNQPTRQRSERNTERRPSSDKDRAKLDSTRGQSSFDRLNALMGD